jgi:hypothetical protein
MFTNDICDVGSDLDVTMKLFADDAKMYSEFDSRLSDDLCTACSRVASWAEKWQMRLATNSSGVARICIWRGLAPKAPEAALGVGPGGGSPPSGRGFGGITPEKILEI